MSGDWTDEFLDDVGDIDLRRGAPDVSVHGRSGADDILDKLDGKRRPTGRKPHECPVCGSNSKVRSSGVSMGPVTRRCVSPECRNEWAQGMRGRITEPHSMPVARSSGPFFGEGGPTVERDQPVHRKISEYQRRMKRNEP